mgnify:FL=1|tara:strand:+ start:4730 stop:5125 length:396 start_codon:yes stop_codon:yes gene_type:complete
MKNKILQFMFWIDECWKLVMDNRYNPLKYIPEPSIQAYFTLILFTVWSFFFGLVATYYLGWYGYNSILSFAIHCSIIIPLLFTRAIFLDAERDGHTWYVNLKSDTERKRFWNKISKPNYEKRAKWNLDKEA